ncbi:hypothetical protein [Oligoflexus tunisiensis]|uniref:hypothetical protein n=1 Tax=Oligoflexus tunisiensis TaxID=708132 RepID=UPI00114CCFF9|nr:hypothetical protein [Oligoflexus tunisiensis]
MIPRRLCYPGPQQGKSWLISIVLGGLLLGGLIWEARQTQSMRAISQAALEAEKQLLDVEATERAPLTLRNPDRVESHEATQQLRLLRQCIKAREGLQACLGRMLVAWRQTPQHLGGFLEALRYQERQPGHEGDPGHIVELVQKLMPESRDRTDVYSLWFQMQRRRSVGLHQRLPRPPQRMMPRYLGMMLKAELAARQGFRTASLKYYETAADSFLEAMLEKMRKSESIAIEAYNQSHDQKDLARLYLQLGWWTEAEKVLYRLAEQEPADQIVLSLMEQLRRRSTQTQAG